MQPRGCANGSSLNRGGDGARGGRDGVEVLRCEAASGGYARTHHYFLGLKSACRLVSRRAFEIEGEAFVGADELLVAAGVGDLQCVILRQSRRRGRRELSGSRLPSAASWASGGR